MYLTGYHGTSKEYAENILKTKIFHQSRKINEWLGNGIYFYTEFEEALEWAKKYHPNNEAVIHEIICIKEDEIMNLDYEDVQCYLNNLILFLDKTLNIFLKEIDNPKETITKIHSLFPNYFDELVEVVYDESENKSIVFIKGKREDLSEKLKNIKKIRNQINQCILSNYLWNKYPNIKVLKSSFPKPKSNDLFVKDFRKQRTEFCVRDNNVLMIGSYLIDLSKILNKNKEEEVIK